MACFIVPMTGAIVTTVVTKAALAKEGSRAPSAAQGEALETGVKTPFSKKLGWLSSMLWGGSALLAFEHVWHGEVTPWAPYLTAAGNPADTAEMLRELSTVGVCMAALVTVVWIGMVLVSSAIEKRAAKPRAIAE